MSFSRYSLAGAITGCLALALVAVLALGVGGSHHARAATKASLASEQSTQVAPAAKPKAQTQTQTLPVTKTPIVPSTPTVGASGGVHASGDAPKVSVGPEGQAVAAEAPDPEASKSFPVSPTQAVHHQAATTPSAAGETAAVAAGAPSDAEVRKELNEM